MVPSLTDNRGNGALLNKLMTTKFPASALLMELSTHMKRMNMRTVVEWAPRDCNREADQLANGIMTGFDPALRLHVSSSSLHWKTWKMRFTREKQQRESTSKQWPRVSCQIGAASRRGRGDRTDCDSPTLGERLLEKELVASMVSSCTHSGYSSPLSCIESLYLFLSVSSPFLSFSLAVAHRLRFSLIFFGAFPLLLSPLFL